ncbi:hypothetical protein HPULCUR_000273 [Helicostylum pulchrum]|uniref:Phosphatidylethanolamine-binding protein n=1 Tax=Helicostylum pulchrum TaxID=562976 RepID=A0ABP9XJE2_9FUNG
MKVTFILLSTATTLFAGAVTAFDVQKIKKELLEGKIVPDALDEFEPVTEMRVTYGEKTVIENGITLKPEHTLIAPRLGFDPKADTEYTMAMVNLDSNAPQVLHWVTTNMNGTGIEERHQFTAYRGPTPPPGAKDHRIVYALFEQENKNLTIPRLSNRVHFDIKKFAAANKLKLVNAVYMFTQPQDGVKRVQNEMKPNGILNDLFDDLDDIFDDLGGVVDVNLGGSNDEDDYFTDEDDFFRDKNDFFDDDDDDFFDTDDFFKDGRGKGKDKDRGKGNGKGSGNNHNHNDNDYDDDDDEEGIHIGIGLGDGIQIGIGGHHTTRVINHPRPTGTRRSRNTHAAQNAVEEEAFIPFSTRASPTSI